MQPLHAREERWFFEWDRLEIARGAGLSLLIIASAFFLVRGLHIFVYPLRIVLYMAGAGLILILLAYALDSGKGPLAKRPLCCRKCKRKTTVGAMQKAGWACGKCGSIGRFDNPG